MRSQLPAWQQKHGGKLRSVNVLENMKEIQYISQQCYEQGQLGVKKKNNFGKPKKNKGFMNFKVSARMRLHILFTLMENTRGAK